MTTVAAIARDGAVYMAADSLCNVYDRPVPGAVDKIARMKVAGEEILVGFSGCAALPGLVAADLDLPAPTPDADPQVWATAIARVVTAIAVTAGLVSDGRMDAHLILGWAGRVWSINHAFAAAHHDGIAAIGSGEGPAIGAIDAMLATGRTPAATVRAAVRIAAARDRYSGAPFQFEQLGEPDPPRQATATLPVVYEAGTAPVPPPAPPASGGYVTGGYLTATSTLSTTQPAGLQIHMNQQPHAQLPAAVTDGLRDYSRRMLGQRLR